MPPRGRAPEGPSGGTVLSGVLARIAKGFAPGLTVLTGDDVFHLDAAQKALLAHLVPQDCPDFALSVYGEAKVDTAELVAAARSMPMFASRRVLLVRDVLALDGEEAPLVAYAKNPPAYSFLLVRATRLDLRRNLHKALAQSGTFLEFRPATSDAEIERTIETLARERNLTLERGVAGFLLEAVARDLYRIASEMDKIAAWQASEKDRRVTLDGARQVVAGGGLLTGWEVANALMARDAGAAVAAVRRLVNAGEEPIRILGGLAYRARTLLQAKALDAAGTPADQIVVAVRAFAFREQLRGAMKRYELHEVRAFPARLLAADRALKSRSLDPRAILETLVTELTAPAARDAQEAS